MDKALKAKQEAPQWKLPAASSVRLATTPFKSFNITHDDACKCHPKTIRFIADVAKNLRFVYLDCPFESGHDAFIPSGLDSKDDQDRIAALDAYAKLCSELYKAGLNRNANQVHGCIHEYLDHGLSGKIFFHPDFEEPPHGLFTKKEQDAYFDVKWKECKATTKAIIPTLPKNSIITLLTDDDDIPSGVTGSVFIRDGVIHSYAELSKPRTPEGLLDYLLCRGFFFTDYSQQLLVIKTADNVHYYRFEDNKLTEVDFETGKDWANRLVKYRGKSLADTPFHELRENEAQFVIAMLEKNDVLKAEAAA